MKTLLWLIPVALGFAVISAIVVYFRVKKNGFDPTAILEVVISVVCLTSIIIPVVTSINDITAVKNAVRFDSDTEMTVKPKYTNSGITLQYSVNDGDSWHTIETGSETPSSKTIYFRGKATGTKSLFTNNVVGNMWIFTNATNLKATGDLDNLIADDFGADPKNIALANDCYSYMFYGCTALVSAPDLPATALAECCYMNMFSGCTALVSAPDLPATALATYCYVSMFYGCTALKYVKIYYTGIETANTQDWLKNVSSSGTMYKAGTQYSTFNGSSCPSGWTQTPFTP